jgi:hypothetical protein
MSGENDNRSIEVEIRVQQVKATLKQLEASLATLTALLGQGRAKELIEQRLLGVDPGIMPITDSRDSSHEQS